MHKQLQKKSYIQELNTQRINTLHLLFSSQHFYQKCQFSDFSSMKQIMGNITREISRSPGVRLSLTNLFPIHLFFSLLKRSEKLTVFRCFQWVEKGCIGNREAKTTLTHFVPIVLFISNISSILQCNRVWVNRTVKEMVQRCIIHSGCPYKDGIDIIVAKIVTAQTADLVTFTKRKTSFLCSDFADNVKVI